MVTKVNFFNNSVLLVIRFQTFPVQNKEKSLCSSTGVESQAPKRQKLEGGHLRKVQSASLEFFLIDW